MLTRFLSIFAVLVLVSGCSTTPEDTSSVITDGEMTVSDKAPMGSLDGIETHDVDTYGPGSGTQQDLVVNVGDRVFFDYDQHELRAEGRSTIERQAEWLMSYPNLQVVVEGHADERGTREYNLALGERRATAVRNYMAALGVDASRITTVSFGKERPAVLGATPTAWAQNRRSVTVVE